MLESSPILGWIVLRLPSLFIQKNLDVFKSLKEPNWLNSVDWVYIIGLIGVTCARLNILKII